jgi:LysR family transcriptional regulator, pca operon transcriptional activator
VTLEDLEVFAQVARDRSFSRAAAALGVAQPSVSSRMAALELELGVKLFHRHHRGVSLSEAGVELLPYARRCLELTLEAKEAVRNVNLRQRLTLGAPPSIAASLFRPIMMDLAEAPVELHLYTGHSWEIKQRLLDGLVQVGFILAGSVPSGIHLEMLHRDPILCVAAAHHPLAGRALTLAGLAAERLLPYSWGPGFEELMNLLRAHRPEGRKLHSVQPAIIARELMLEHGYISFLPRLTVAKDLKAGILVRLEVSDLPQWTWDVAVAYRERKTRDPALETVLEAIHNLPWSG